MYCLCIVQGILIDRSAFKNTSIYVQKGRRVSFHNFKFGGGGESQMILLKEKDKKHFCSKSLCSRKTNKHPVET